MEEFYKEQYEIESMKQHIATMGARKELSEFADKYVSEPRLLKCLAAALVAIDKDVEYALGRYTEEQRKRLAAEKAERDKNAEEVPF